MSSQKQLAENEIFDGRYVLLEKIWTDGNLTYWRSFDEAIGREVVLFIVPMGTSDVEDARKNIKITARLQHPHIIPIYDLRETGEYLYAVQFYAVNRSILEYLEQRKSEKLSIKSILRLTQQLASAIDYIHTEEIVHHHIRLEVILLDKELNLYLTEFHVPRTREKLTTKYGVVEYAAPEQFTDSQLSASCDIYGFGMTLFHLFAHQLPFTMNKENPFFASLGWIQQYKDPDKQLPSVRQVRPELPIGVDLVLGRLTHKDPQQRYVNANAAAEELTRVLYSRQSSIKGRIFISYASKDKDYVHRLAAELGRIGVDMWIDQDIEPRANWVDSIENALNTCDLMLLVATETAMSSEYVIHEWSYFMGQGKPIYLFIPQMPPPKNIHPRLSRIQLVTGTGDMLNDIFRIVDALAGGTPTKLNTLGN
jgi:serine/threonine protein kinase